MGDGTRGGAGQSAAREYERRAARERARQEAAVAEDTAWRARVKAEHPFLGRAVAAFTAKPEIGGESQATRAWAQGAAGERVVGAMLDGCSGAVVLHDRRIPGSRANIDHIAVSAAGVFVIDAKRYHGKVEARDVGGWLRTDQRLYVANRDRTKLVDAMAHQVEVVRAACAASVVEAVAVQPVLCFVDAAWPVFGRPLRVRGVTVVQPTRLAAIVGAPGPLGPSDIDALAAALTCALPST